MSEETKNPSAEQPAKAKEPKKSKAQEELKKVKEELEQTKDLLMRTAAEFDNFKKRTDREKASIAEFAKASFAKELLGLIDNAERALSADSSSADYAKGLEMIIKQISALPEKVSLEKLANVGDEFDPRYHEAVMHIEDDSKPENSIVAVLQQGYKLGDTVVRPAMVQVAN